jgi:thioredoxin-like negative regulator of GroEL
MSMENYADKCGWNVETQLELALQYIANQGSDDAFDDFLQEIADEECQDDSDE